ncbi:hypothetical protein RHRU231_860039 [Rhodococcus ruber]|uniref:Uncharacterized protein n=1 Tax=Rhodococcus ruber TaxID=1830 RepID=A0A098BSF2_9NOCA|nr:hypothetical protein RHRU231_860039 [Rhodococcus ruber]
MRPRTSQRRFGALRVGFGTSSRPDSLDDREEGVAVLGTAVDLPSIDARVLDDDTLDHLGVLPTAARDGGVPVDHLVDDILGQFVVGHGRDRPFERLRGCHVGLLLREALVQRLALLFLPLRGAESVGTAPALRRVHDLVTVVVADFVGVEALAGAEGVAGAVFDTHDCDVPEPANAETRRFTGVGGRICRGDDHSEGVFPWTRTTSSSTSRNWWTRRRRCVRSRAATA